MFIELHPVFKQEFDLLSEAAQDEIVATSRLLEEYGPTLRRPHADTLKVQGAPT